MNPAQELGTFGRCPTGPALDWLRRAGVKPDTIDFPEAGGPVSTADIEIDGDFFDFSEGGSPAFVHPVWSADGVDVLDVIAWRLADPSRWWTRTGATTMLGEAVLQASHALGFPLPIRRTPLAWLAVSGFGVVVLDWPAARLDLVEIAESSGLVAEYVGHGDEIEALLRGPLPSRRRIFVPTPVGAIAA